MTDVALFDTPDRGDICIEAGEVVTGGGLEAAAYMSLFGGNVDDPGSIDSRQQWWGNLNETEPARQYRSQTQHLLRSLPAVTSNMLRIQDAVEADLAWFVSEGVASSVTVAVSMPALNTVRIVIDIIADERETTITYTQNWKADSGN